LLENTHLRKHARKLRVERINVHSMWKITERGNDMWPQITVIVLLILGLGVAIGTHGNPKEGNKSFWETFINSFITTALLYWGGFFDVLFK
jgi:hypothetical protein